jgi:MIP family channel proteins
MGAEEERAGRGGAAPGTDSGHNEPDGRAGPSAEPGPRVDPARRLLTEVLGTFALTLVAAGGEVIAGLSGGEVSAAARATAPGLLVLAVIYAVGDVSGAHINPAVTLAFALRGVFPWRRVPAYWLAQMAGAVGAAAFLLATFGLVAQLGATRPGFGVAPALAMEVALTWLLVTVVLGTATRDRVVGPNAALAVGATVALCGLFAGPVSGASMNPARSLGPALVSAAAGGGAPDDSWIYLLGPAAGAGLACAGIWLVKGSQRQGERKAAAGGGA